MAIAFEKANFDFEEKNIEKEPIKEAFTKAVEADLSEQQITVIDKKIKAKLHTKDNPAFNDMIQRARDRLIEPKQAGPKSKSLGL